MEFFNKNYGFEDIYSIDSTSTADCCLINKYESQLDEGKKLLALFKFIQKNPFLITNSLHLPLKNIYFKITRRYLLTIIYNNRFDWRRKINNSNNKIFFSITDCNKKINNH